MGAWVTMFGLNPVVFLGWLSHALPMPGDTDENEPISPGLVWVFVGMVGAAIVLGAIAWKTRGKRSAKGPGRAALQVLERGPEKGAITAAEFETLPLGLGMVHEGSPAPASAQEALNELHATQRVPEDGFGPERPGLAWLTLEEAIELGRRLWGPREGP